MQPTIYICCWSYFSIGNFYYFILVWCELHWIFISNSRFVQKQMGIWKTGYDDDRVTHVDVVNLPDKHFV